VRYEPEKKELTGIRRLLNMNTVGLVMLLVALVLSVSQVLTNHQEMNDPNMTIVNIAHWQLEMGYRSSLQDIIDEYNKIHEKDKVKVEQMPVTEKVYKQWLNTHLISGTAPDIAEMGMAKLTQTGGYVAKYFLPLTDLIAQPNPYNKGTDLEGVAWRDTYIDGMQGGYQEDLQDYYKVPTTFWAIRLYYNKDLLREATGKEGAPETLGELLDVCKKVRELGEKKGRKLVPIAGSQYTTNMFLSRFGAPFTAVYEQETDTDFSGGNTTLETFAALERGVYNFNSPHIVGLFECIKTLCDQFSNGFNAMGREQAAFMFVQGNAAMIASGSWDAESLFKQARFNVGIMSFLAPAPGERWGDLVSAKVNEAQGAAGGGYGIYKYSRNKKWAIDFMHFFSSKKYNERFNRNANWVPCIVGTRPTKKMMPFMPDPVGISGGAGLYFRRAGHISTVFEGAMLRYLTGESLYEEFTKAVMEAVNGPKEWDKEFVKFRIFHGALIKYLTGEIAYEEFTRETTKTVINPDGGIKKVWAGEYVKFRQMARDIDRLLGVESVLMEMGGEFPEISLRYKRALVKQNSLESGEYIRHDYYLQHQNTELPRE